MGILTGIGLFLKGIPLKFWLILGLVIALVAGGFWVKGKVEDHFKHVAAIEARNKKLVETNTKLVKQTWELAGINTANKNIYDQRLRQAEQARRIAEEERKAAEARAVKYRSARDAAKATPPQDRRPVGTAVQSTVDRLWDPR